MTRTRLLLFLLMLFCAACEAQTKGTTTITAQPASGAPGALTWPAPANCTASGAAPCTYQMYVQTASACPSQVIGSSGWVTLGSAQSATTLTDNAEAPGSSEIYFVVTLQSGEQSAPSNCVALVFPTVPAAPVLSGTS